MRSPETKLGRHATLYETLFSCRQEKKVSGRKKEDPTGKKFRNRKDNQRFGSYMAIYRGDPGCYFAPECVFDLEFIRFYKHFCLGISEAFRVPETLLNVMVFA